VALLRPVPPILAVLAVLVVLVEPQLDLNATIIDPIATAAGLRARVGPLEDWSITVRDSIVFGEVEVSLRSPDGRTLQRQIALTGASHEDRSRELAASLALVIEQWDDPPEVEPEPEPEPTPPVVPPTPPPVKPPPQKPSVRGWLGVGPRLELFGSRPEAGADLQGGAWLLGEHLQPLLSVGWSYMGKDHLSLQTIRFGAGMAAGAPLARGRLWLGAHGIAHAAWTRVHDQRTEIVWGTSSELGGLLQVRGRRWLLGLRTGVDLAFPRLHARGRRDELTRVPGRWMLALTIGVVFG
jgi:hypothetical protein